MRYMSEPKAKGKGNKINLGGNEISQVYIYDSYDEFTFMKWLFRVSKQIYKKKNQHYSLKVLLILAHMASKVQWPKINTIYFLKTVVKI